VVSSVPNAVKAAAAGVDAVIAEGSESGGMQGFNGASTMVLVPLVVDAVNVPVVAAGGIGDSRGYKAAFNLGAVGVQVGTAFIAAEECIAHGNYKNALVSASETDTRLMDVQWAQIRVLATPMAEDLMAKGGFSRAEFAAQGESMEEAWIKGDLSASILGAGQITGMVKAVRPVREIIEEMVHAS
jgi:enoyl-[acyl-carrier protein] reductase II